MNSLGRFLAHFAVTGLTAVRTALTGFVRAIATSLRALTISAPLKGLQMGARAATSALRSTAKIAKTLLSTLTGIASLGAIGISIVGVGNLKRAVVDAEEYIRTLEKISNTLGISMKDISVFAGYAGQLGFELEDARQAFTQFFGVAGEAQKGKNEYSAVFKQVGMDMTDVKYKTMGVVELLQEFANRIQKFQGSNRTGILTALFGDDDATKVATLLDKMAKNPIIGGKPLNGLRFDGSNAEFIEAVKLYWKAIPGMKAYEALQKRMESASAIVSDRDVALQQQYKSGLEDLRMTVRGLQMTMFRAFGPAFIDMMKQGADWLIKNHLKIVDRMVNAWNAFGRVVHDFRVIFRGMEPRFAVTNQWMVTLRDTSVKAIAMMKRTWEGLKVVWDGVKQAAVIMGHSFQRLFLRLMNETGNGAKAMSILSGDMQVSTENISGFFDGMGQRISDAIVFMAHLMSDIGSVLAMEDQYIVTGAGKTMAGWRDAMLGHISGVIVGIQSGFAYLLGLWTLFQAGFMAGDPTLMADPMYKFGSAVRYVTDLLQNLLTVVTGGDATAQFEWLNVARDLVLHFAKAVEFAFGAFTQYVAPAYLALEAFLNQFNVDLGGTLLIAYLLGLGPLVSRILLGVLGVFWTFISALVGTVWAGLAPIVGAWIASLTAAIIAGLAGLLTAIGGWMLSLAGTILAGLASLVAGVPALILAAVLTLLAGLVYLIWKNWGSYAQVFGSVGELLVAMVSQAANDVVRALGYVWEKVSGLVKIVTFFVVGIGRAFGDGLKAVGEAFDILGEYFMAAVDLAKWAMGDIGGAIAGAVGWIGGSLARIGGGAYMAADAIRWAFGQVGQAFWMVGSAGSAAGEQIKNAWFGMPAFFQERIEAIKALFKPAWDQIRKWGSDAWEWTKATWNQASPYFWAVVDPIYAAFMWAFDGIGKIARIGWGVVTTVWGGLSQFFQDPLGTSAKLWDAFWTNVIEGGRRAYEQLKSMLGPFGWALSGIELGANIIGAGVQSVRDAAGVFAPNNTAPIYAALPPSNNSFDYLTRPPASSQPDMTVAIQIPGVEKPVQGRFARDAFQEVRYAKGVSVTGGR